MTNHIKYLVLFSLVLLFLPSLLTGCANAQANDTLTDKAMLAELEKLHDKKYNKDDVCIKRVEESVKVVVIGLKDEAAVCRFAGVFIDSRFFEKGNLESSKTALSSLGWETANEQMRRKLAKLWVEKILFAFSAESNRSKRIFRVVPTDNDGIEVIVSLQFPPGVTSRHAPKSFLFDKDGNMSGANDY